MKLCLIGCGDFARRFHGPAQRRCAAEDDALELAGCCDVDAKRAADYARDFGFARAHANPAEMLDAERPDAVVLAVPPVLTCAVAGPILARGLPLLLEKPPGLTGEELGRLVDAAEKGGAMAQVGFNRRYMPVMRRAREILDAASATSAATRIDYEMLRSERWDADFSTTAVHAIDALCFLAGSPFRSVRLDYQPLRRDVRETAGVSVGVECRSGLRARLEIQPVAGRNSESVRIHGLGWTVALRLPFPGKTPEDGRVELWRDDELVESFGDGGMEAVERMGVLGETRAFLAAVRAGRSGAPGLSDCDQQVRVMAAMRGRETGVNGLPRG